ELGSVVAELVGDRKAGGIVAGVIDAIAAGQALDRLALEVAVDAQVLLGDEGVYVRLNRKCHDEILSVGQALVEWASRPTLARETRPAAGFGRVCRPAGPQCPRRPGSPRSPASSHARPPAFVAARESPPSHANGRCAQLQSRSRRRSGSFRPDG